MIKINNKTLGQRIAYFRKSKNISQTVFANRIKLSATSLSNLENGKFETISIAKLNNIATALNVTLDQLLIDILKIFQNRSSSIKPKSLYYLKLYETLQHLTDNQKIIVSSFFRYIIKKIENQAKTD